jgi:hypothetical protein
MLLTQKFHSLKEIDQEFIPALEALMHEHQKSFAQWLSWEEQTPEDITFCYWLFFGPTQNSPVGIAQVQFTKVDTQNHLPWWKQFQGFFDKKLSHWKKATWRLGSGLDGAALFDVRYQRSGKEKLNSILEEVFNRPDVIKVELELPSSIEIVRPKWQEIYHESHDSYLVLKAFNRDHKNYQDYLESLPSSISTQIKASWKELHKTNKITLGDYATIADRRELFDSCPDFDPTELVPLDGGILSFQKNQNVLGVVHYYLGNNETLFIEPITFEVAGEEIVPEELYIQYGLIKTHEMSAVKKVMILQNGAPLRLIDREQAEFFQDQGFLFQKIQTASWCKTPYYS